MGKSINHILRVLLILSVTLLTGGLFSTKEHKYRWVFVYYISYDNDLSVYGSKILEELARGVINDETAVVTQTDFSDSGGMKRVSFYGTGGKMKRRETPLRSEDSADPKELKKFFDWVQDNWKADNYCVFLLDHGGSLNNICKDDRPFNVTKVLNKSSTGKWLSALDAGKIIADFNREVDGKVRLLFLQQCARGSIQNLYSFADTSEYIMASPLKVGVPNTYYAKMLQSAADDPNITPFQIARTILREDEDYTLYSLIDCNELKKLPEKLKPVLDAFSRAGTLKPPQDCLPLFEYEDEKFYDLKSYFQALSFANKTGERELKVFFDWCDNKLISAKLINNSKNIPFDKSWRSGLSIYVPTSKKEFGRYDFLPLYQQTNLYFIKSF